jgi:hypothetical protein
VQISALSAAVIIATQITLEHWFYLYIAWFFGALIAAVAADTGEDEEIPEPREKDVRVNRSRARAKAQLNRARPGAKSTASSAPDPPSEFEWPTRRAPGEQEA